MSSERVVGHAVSTDFSPPAGDPVFSREFGAYSICERTYKPNLRLKRHSHGNAFFNVPLAGTCTETLAGREYLCQTDMIWYRPLGVPHSNVFHEHGARMLLIELRPAMLEDAKAHAGITPEISFMLNPRLRGLTRRVREELWGDVSEGNRLVLDCLVMELLFASQGGRLPPANSRSTAAVRAADLLRYELTARRDLREVARIVGVHPVHLCRDFKKRFHCTMGEYLLRSRVEQAKLLLIQSDVSLTEIGLQCGFYDHSHFTRSFKKIVGINPQKYRKTHRG